ncbi:AAA family ATPase [Bradyrhizobium archetypum]|uniref:AAA family ATPase n=1 Tax=Bradyrhizobium archetypum TaxID=2721160 RepID=A0A7Y4H6V7_9BRAD|nr:adenylate/guanylate cyclase domain-containing protein [Bradyrhizobium archetypum]NOJ48756.1 AAA family ATPase [Bradyrhizobium archetypum]
MTRTTTDVAEWLDQHGLARYAQTFIENNIDYDVLPDLTENDLKNLGVSLGHRKTLLRAIETLAVARQASTTTATAQPATEALLPSEHREAERRQITVLFCDLVGSTQLSEKLDPEDLQVLIDVYRSACTAAIRRYEGHVARYLGDGVMAFFGYPRAHEDDPVRAVHAALEMLSAITNIPGPVTLAARVGISSGPVVVGEIAGSGTATTRDWMDAVGETPNIAARLQALASPNALVISESTKRLVSAAFDLQDLGPQELKGVTRPLHVYRVLGAMHTASRFEAAHGGSLTPLAGRSTELNLLLDKWGKAKEGDGQVVLVSGIPGVGKSRLIHELKSNIQHEPCFVLQHQCSAYHSQSAFFPVIERIEQAAKLTAGDSDTEKLAKLKAYLADSGDDSIETALLIANLLSIPIQSHHELSELTPQQIKNRTVSKLVDMILAFSAQRPTLCIFEDVHWIDPTSLELLELIINQIDHARVLLIVSHRPEFRPTWSTHPNVAMHSLTRLSRSEVTGMIRDILRGQSIPQETLNQVIEKSDGVPLFIEELTSSILSAPTQSRPVEGDVERTAAPPIVPSVPETLHDALIERLDRVPQGRRLAQIAAVIGREFSYDLLSVALRISEDELHQSLLRLEEAGIIYRVGISPFIRFAFKHALLRDAIYNSLLRSSRRQIHGEIAAILADQFGEFVENRPEILAYHYSEGGNNGLAVRWWFKSGQHALAYSANVEAISHYRKALEALSALPESPARDKQEIEIQLALGIPLIAVRGYPADETRDAFARARTLCLKLDSRPEYFQALFGEWGNRWMGGKNDEALSMANEFLSRSRESTDSVPLMMAHRVMGSTLLTVGEFQSSKHHFEESIALSKQQGQRLSSLYMVEPQVASLLILSWDLWFLGYPDQALSRVSEALALARELAQPYTIAFAHYMTSVVHLLRGEPGRALASAEQSLEMSWEQRFSLYILLSQISRGHALAGLGQIAEAQTQIKLGLEEARKKGVGYFLPMMNSWLADAHAQSGDHATALSIVEQIIANTSDRTGRSWEAELHHQRARILLALDPARAREAEADLRQAIEVARRQSAKSLELRAATTLAEIWRTQGRFDEARDLIGPIYRWFDEGYDTKDLMRARDIQLGLTDSGRLG